MALFVSGKLYKRIISGSGKSSPGSDSTKVVKNMAVPAHFTYFPIPIVKILKFSNRVFINLWNHLRWYPPVWFLLISKYFSVTISIEWFCENFQRGFKK